MNKQNLRDLPSKEVMTLSETAAFLSVSKQTLRNWDRQGILKAVRYGVRGDRKYLTRDIQALLQKEE